METSKLCSKCGLGFEATKEFFYSFARYSDGLRPDCKTCFNKAPSIKMRLTGNPPGRKPGFVCKKSSIPSLSRKETNHRRNEVIKKDPIRKLIARCRIRTNLALKDKSLKACKTMDLLGCSREFLKAHLESQFKPGMSWENHNRSGWHIDHIKPCSKFDFSDPAQQKECFHYTNLQPLWAKENISKGNRF